jgi:hypothetical protein
MDNVAVRKTVIKPGVLEALVALSVLVALSGVLMPIVGEEVGQSRAVTALADLQSIAEGLGRYSRDTLYLPTGVEGRTNVAWLYGPGTIPTGHAFGAGGEARPLDDALLSDAMGGETWSGPYIPGLHPDPWGYAYLVNADGWLTRQEQPMVLSAGPDGIVQTPADAWEPTGDDILLVLD